jgi:hypothetical protein
MSMERLKQWVVGWVYWHEPDLTYSERRPDMDKLVLQAVCANLYAILTTGVFLAGYLIYLGAPEWLTSYAALLPTICCMAVPLSAGMVEKRAQRLNMVIVLSALHRVLFLLILAAPLVLEKRFAVPVCCFLLVASYSINGIYGMAFNSIFLSLIPLKIRGRYLSARQVILTFVNAVFPIAAGMVVDLYEGAYAGFLVIYAVAAAAGALECFINSRLSNPVIKGMKKRLRIRDIFTIPAKDKKFMRFTVPFCLFYLFINLGASFTYVYMLQYLNLSYTYINTLAMVCALLQILVFYRFWGRVNDRISANFTMLTSICLYIPEVILWGLTTPKVMLVTLPVCYCLSALNVSGFVIGSYNRRFELIPEEGLSYYDSFATACTGLMFLISPVVAGFLRDAARSWSFIGGWTFGNIRVVYLIGAALMILLQIFSYIHLKHTSPSDPALRKESYKEALTLLLRELPFKIVIKT